MKSISAKIILPCMLLIIALIGCYLVTTTFKRESVGETITLKNETFSVRIADTPELRAHGLSGSDPLIKNQGMVFIFPDSDFHGFWMKDMKYSIDILWFDDKRVLIDFEENVHPETYPKVFTPDLPAQYVIELPAGSVSRLGLTRNEKFFWSN